ncbi:MAG: hypothetical protein ACRDPE_20040 [Solirubrobacterales bacterium]
MWSFNGGRIVVQEQQPGVFEGTVVAPTTFSLCAHPEGEQIWTQMVEQPDGSYWGNHQWFFETSECVRNPAPGPTAWRVLQNAEGRYLRACFSEPGSNLQPTIAPSGASANATFGCVDSSLLAVLPEASASKYLSLPSNRSCTARRTLRVRIKSPKDNPVQQIVVTATGGGVTVKGKIHRTAKGIFAVVPLARLTSPRFAVKVSVTTLLGDHLTKKRSYRRCSTVKPKASR